MRLTGKVIRKPFATGTKSERPGIYLVSPAGEYLMRRRGGNPFRDPELEALVEHDVRVEGTIHDYLLIVSSWEIVR
jgi:hypothetical protein